MDALARITLLEPFPGIVEVTYGFGDARVVSSAGDIVAGILAGDDVVDAGAHQAHMPRAIARTIPGVPNRWTLEWDTTDGDGKKTQQRRSALVPRDAARLWFGDERIPKVAGHGIPTEMTFNFERNRVATRWGGWRMPQRALNGRNACSKGENDFDLSKIGSPRIPNVKIEKIDSSGSVVGTAFEPWVWFKWEADVDSTHPELAATASAQQATAAQGLAGFSLADLEAFVAMRRAQEEASAPTGKGK